MLPLTQSRHLNCANLILYPYKAYLELHALCRTALKKSRDIVL